MGNTCLLKTENAVWALLLHRHKCGTTSVLAMYTSMVYKSDLFKIELDIEKNMQKRLGTCENIFTRQKKPFVFKH